MKFKWSFEQLTQKLNDSLGYNLVYQRSIDEFIKIIFCNICDNVTKNMKKHGKETVSFTLTNTLAKNISFAFDMNCVLERKRGTTIVEKNHTRKMKIRAKILKNFSPVFNVMNVNISFRQSY